MNRNTKKIEINGEILEITALGGGCEVGRSCVILRYGDRTIMFDCGLHQAFHGLGSLPYFDEVDPAEIDLLLITHIHIDHCAAVPYFLEKTNFKGECYMTPPTKALYKPALLDCIKVSHINTDESLYEEGDIERSFEKIKLIDYHQEFTVKDIKFWAYNAGHVLGAAMFMVEIQGIRVLYTGDFSREVDRHLKPAEIPLMDVHVLVIESTYGTTTYEPRKDRENQFTKSVAKVVTRGGKCLLPVLTLGSAQELLLMLDEYWKENQNELKDITIYYAGSAAIKGIKIFQTFINMMGDTVKNQCKKGQNPFEFQYVTCVPNIENFEFKDPVVVMTGPGMLQNGPSRNLFEKWCSDARNGVIITGYCVEGTLAKKLLKESKDEIDTTDGRKVKPNIEVMNVFFSAHSDFTQTSDFIEKVKPLNIVLVHGNKKQTEKLKIAVVDKYKGTFNFKIFNPQNCQKLEFCFKAQRSSYIVGNLSSNIHDYIRDNLGSISLTNTLSVFPTVNTNLNDNDKKSIKSISGGNETRDITLFNANTNNNENMDVEMTEQEATTINNNNQIASNEEIIDIDENYYEFSGIIAESENIVIDNSEVQSFSQLKINKMKQQLSINFTQCSNVLFFALSDFFEDFKHVENNQYLINDKIKLIVNKENVVLEWFTSPVNDLVADSVTLLIYQLESHPTSEVFQHYSDHSTYCQYKIKYLINYLKAKFGEVEQNNGKLIVRSGNNRGEINTENFSVKCESQELNIEIESELKYFFSL